MWWKLAGVLGAVGVAMGAFGAHGLQGRGFDASDIAVWNTAARYQLVHALALLGVAAHPRKPALIGWLFTIGTLVFSGSLYALVLTQIKLLGAITPLGGLCFIAGWALLVVWPTRAMPLES